MAQTHIIKAPLNTIKDLTTNTSLNIDAGVNSGVYRLWNIKSLYLI